MPGRCWLSRECRSAPDATSGDVEIALAAAGAPLLVQVVDRLADGHVDAVAQDPALVTSRRR